MLGSDDPHRASRAHLLSLLFAGGWDIYNSNGDQRITLSNIERKIIESDAFIFTPGATLEDMFKAISIFVGYQTLDENLNGKPTIILNEDGSWDAFFDMLRHLQKMGTIKQDHRDYLATQPHAEAAIEALEKVKSQQAPVIHPVIMNDSMVTHFESPYPEGHIGNACVFCSASLQDPGYVADGEELGRLLALNRIGCVSGAGGSGIMGAVVRGAVQAEGWTGGSNVPHIIEQEGLPDGLSSFWPRPDIYTRMEVMIENSDAFVIFPGGAGTLQELFALLIFKQQGNPLMAGKPIVIFNREDSPGIRFWNPLIDLLSYTCEPGDFMVANSLDDVLIAIRQSLCKTSTEIAKTELLLAAA